MITAADIEQLQKGMGHWQYHDDSKFCPSCEKTYAIARFRMKKAGNGVYYRSNKCKKCEAADKARRQRARAVGG